jgi:two-component sensor histidine kinase
MTVFNFSEASSADDRFMALAELDQAALDALPDAVYLCAGDGTVVRFNQKAVELWGRAPKAGDPKERFTGSFRLYQTDGGALPHDQGPMAVALRTGKSGQDQEVVVERPDGRRLTVQINIAVFEDEKGRVNGAVSCFRDITERKRAEERQRHLIEELNHRIRNMFATVQSMAVNTARDASSIDEFKSRFEARLIALSHAHALFNDGGTSAALCELLAQQLEPFGGRANPRVRFEGPEVDLEPRLALALSMVFHELTTNAAKYGPLSVTGGQIAVAWGLLPDAEGGRSLTLQWLEMDGPPVETPRRTGFGTRLIKRTITDGLGGEADLLFNPAGLQLWMSIPLPN